MENNNSDGRKLTKMKAIYIPSSITWSNFEKFKCEDNYLLASQ
jgi:hypothetical protein